MGKYIHITQTSILLGDLLKRYNTTMMKIYLLILVENVNVNGLFNDWGADPLN